MASEYASSVTTNVQEALDNEEPGYQLLLAGQAALILFVLVGQVPLVGDWLELVSGPGLMLAGCGFGLAGVLELGPTNLTPFATPVKGNEFKTNGVYGLSRHPMYTGLLTACLGLAVATDSVQRIVVTALLFLFLDYKASLEENQLVKIHPAYPAYQYAVPKFVPDVASLFDKDDFDDDDDDDDFGDDE